MGICKRLYKYNNKISFQTLVNILLNDLLKIEEVIARLKVRNMEFKIK